MNLNNIRRVDLNLLITFIALMNERSVTRAAKSLYITQSAVSASLKKLRVIFDDELFIRTSYGILPTQKAVMIAPIIKETLTNLSVLFNSSSQENTGYIPDISDNFCIGLSDELESLVIQKLLFATKDYPISFTFYPTDSHFWPKLFEEHNVDLVITPNPMNISAAYQDQILFSSSYSCIFDNDIYKLSGPISLASYVTSQHARVIFDGGRTGFLDEYFEQEGYTRNVKANFFNYSTAVGAILGTKLLVTIPTYAATAFATNYSQLSISPVPFSLSPTFVVKMIWSMKNKNQDKLIWIRNLINNIMKS